jgi:hypothetical protein
LTSDIGWNPARTVNNRLERISVDVKSGRKKQGGEDRPGMPLGYRGASNT